MIRIPWQLICYMSSSSLIFIELLIKSNRPFGQTPSVGFTQALLAFAKSVWQCTLDPSIAHSQGYQKLTEVSALDRRV